MGGPSKAQNMSVSRPSASRCAAVSLRCRRARYATALSLGMRSESSSPVSRGSREVRGSLTVACALVRYGWGGSGRGSLVGVAVEAAGKDGAV